MERKVKNVNGRPEKMILTSIPELRRRGLHGILVQGTAEIDLPPMQIIEGVKAPVRELKAEIKGVPTRSATVGNRAVNSVDHVLSWINQLVRDETGRTIIRGGPSTRMMTQPAVRQLRHVEVTTPRVTTPGQETNRLLRAILRDKDK